MRTLVLIIAAAALACAAASPVEAARSSKYKKSGETVHAAKPRRAIASAQSPAYNSSGVRAGPLYNGQDYIGDDPDPNIRAYLIKDMTRYQGSY